jgi:hypothetical protein
MTRAHNEAEAGRPTVEQEMAAFKGFSVQDGETVTPENPEDLNPVAGKNMSAAELEAAKNAENAGKKAADKPAAGAAKTLTQDEQDKVINDLDKKLGREATEEEVTKALADATNTKNGSGAKPRDAKSAARYRRMERERNEAVARANSFEARLAALESGKTAPLTDKDKPGKVTDAEGPPDPKSFEYGELDTNYIRALARWEAKQEIADAAKNQQKASLSAEEKANKEKFEAARAEFEDKGSELHDDFYEVVIEGARDKAWPLSDTLGASLLTSEYGPQIAYWLASPENIEEAKKVAKMPDLRQIAWLGRKEAELESAGSGENEGDKEAKAAAAAKAEAAKSTRKVSKAPAPIPRARGQGSASAVPGDTQDFAAFEAAAMGRTK